MYMDDSDHRAADQSYKEHDASAMSLQVITDTLPVVHPKEASVQTSSATPSPSSSGDGGSPMSVQMLLVQGSEAPEGAKPMECISKASTDEQVAPDYSSEDHENWFHEFVNAVENPEVWTWNDIEEVLDKGRSLGYLTQSIGWDDDKYTPLHYAAEEGAIDVVQELIEERNIPVDIRTGECKRTPLHLAALKGHLAVVKYLINQGAALHATDKGGSYSLHYAALGVKGEANTGVVAYLHSKGASLETVLKEFNLLYLAIRVGNASLVKYLLEQCPSLINQEVDGVTPLAYAQAKQEISIAKTIQEKIDDQS